MPAADSGVFVYRDDSEPAPRPRTTAEDDTAYWYDLLAEDPVPPHEEARGPFEPLVSSSGPPAAGTSSPSPADDGGAETHERDRARTLDQLKDLYLTAEAIGDHNVDKHFNELLARQRQLISEYFGQDSPAAGDQAEAQQAGDATPPEGLAVRAVPPRT